MPTSQYDILTQIAPAQTSLSEENRKNPVIIGVVCTVLFHILLYLVAPLLPVDRLGGTHSNLDAIAARKNKTFDFQLEPLPPEEVKPDRFDYVGTNPDAPTNEPDKTTNISNRNQQSAQQEVAKEIDPEKRPAVKGEDINEDSAIVSGDNANPQQGASVTPTVSKLQTEEQVSHSARAEQTPPSGNEKDEGKSEDGMAVSKAPNQDTLNNAEKLIQGVKDGKVAGDAMVNTTQANKVQPKPRPRLSQARSATLFNKTSGVNHTGLQAIDAFKTEYGDYLAEMWEIMGTTLDSILEDSQRGVKSGTYVDVIFKMNSSGEITILRVEETAGKPLTYAALAAIQTPQPYRKWSEQMIALLGNEQQLTWHLYVP